MGKNTIEAGRPAPDGALRTPAGEAVALSSLWDDGQYVLLLFLRHLG
jgi:hypothetical protein